MKAIGDVAAGDKEKFKSLTLAFGQVSSAGKLTGQDLLQMINAGFNPLQVISEKTGKSMSELKDEMAKGNISARDVAEAFAIATGEGGKFNNMMDKQSQTLEGLKSTLGDEFQLVLKKIGDALLSKAKWFTQLAISIVKGISGMIDGITRLWKEGQRGLVILDATWSRMTGNIERYNEKINEAVRLTQEIQKIGTENIAYC